MFAAALLLATLQGPPVGAMPAVSIPAVSEKKVSAVRTGRPLAIDGRDDDDVWRTVPIISEFQEFDPVEGKTPRFRTEARVACDSRNLSALFLGSTAARVSSRATAAEASAAIWVSCSASTETTRF